MYMYVCARPLAGGSQRAAQTVSCTLHAHSQSGTCLMRAHAQVRLYINNVTALDQPRLRRIFAERGPEGRHCSRKRVVRCCGSTAAEHV